MFSYQNYLVIEMVCITCIDSDADIVYDIVNGLNPGVIS